MTDHYLTEDTLPAGYAIVCGMACHVAKLRKFTPDPRRFLAYVPMVEELWKHKAWSPEWMAVVERCDDPELLAKTQAELTPFLLAMAGGMEAEVKRRNPGPEAA